MIRAPFIRLALLALCSIYLFGLVFSARLVGGWWALGIATGGVALALLLAIELPSDESETKR
ncbi:MAG: hypothetical protein ABSC36_00565 [Gaiellaceae bacterium]|jgi:hypothetical protein